MKATLLLLLLGLSSTGLFAQASSETKTNDCFNQWYTLFRERGASPIADGTHDVIISLRHSGFSECYMGKIDVTAGKLSSKLQIQKLDGSFAEFDKKVSAAYQNSEGVLKEESLEVTNGMSASIAMDSGEIVRLFFYKSIAEKPKANKRAPAPSALIKN